MSFYYTLPLLASSMVLALAAPAASNMTTETGYGNFEPEPQGRGTWSLLFSCTATFGFCIWTAMHPNILFGVSSWHRFRHKAMLMLGSIIYPEFMVVAAFSEWQDARKLHAAWKQRFPQHPDYLGMDGAFLVVMGGFVFDTRATWDVSTLESTGSEATLTPALRDVSAMKSTGCEATLTPAGFLKYFREGRINEDTFDKAAILDKSKANNIAKLVSGSQALWLSIACFARWNASLPLSLLEIHVLIQVACTFFVFCLWWSKPLDVQEPLTIKSGPDRMGTDGGAPPIQHTYRDEPPRSDTRRSNQFYITKRPSFGTVAEICKAHYDVVVAVSPADLSPNETGSRAFLQRVDVRRAIMEAFFVVSVGIAHAAAAWHTKFPTDIERTLWRVCSIGMCVLIPSAGCIGLIGGFHKDAVDACWCYHLKRTNFGDLIGEIPRVIAGIAEKHSPKSGRGLWCNWRYYVCYVSFCVFISHFFCYVTCVLFITVESYISLRAPPEGTFTTPRWNDYWPHL